MSAKHVISGIVVVAIAIVVWVIFLRAPQAQTPNNGRNTAEETPVKLFEPQNNAIVSSPLTLRGEARGAWYFEASFPMKLLDANNNQIAVTPAQAQGDWMTENFVPFLATLEFESPATETGMLVLQKDNPSGLPEFDAEIKIPVRFNPESEEMSVQAFFSNTTLDPDILDCAKVFPVTRTIHKTEASARAALLELLKGPNPVEQEAGFMTSLNSGVEIQSLTIQDGKALADFSPRLDENMGGSCRVTAIRAQITQTLLQFPTVREVAISIDGKTDLILQP
ncbi:MAG: GerMN domain-containing protein [Parcubacteria group bacterium]|nr:GerMN domain-containing protein [Parcubacteria group bacterium]